MRVRLKFCVCVHDEFRLGVALKYPLLVRRTKLGQAGQLSSGTPGQSAPHTGTVARWNIPKWVRPRGNLKNSCSLGEGLAEGLIECLAPDRVAFACGGLVYVRIRDARLKAGAAKAREIHAAANAAEAVFGGQLRRCARLEDVGHRMRFSDHENSRRPVPASLR